MCWGRDGEEGLPRVRISIRTSSSTERRVHFETASLASVPIEEAKQESRPNAPSVSRRTNQLGAAFPAALR